MEAPLQGAQCGRLLCIQRCRVAIPPTSQVSEEARLGFVVGTGDAVAAEIFS